MTSDSFLNNKGDAILMDSASNPVASGLDRDGQCHTDGLVVCHRRHPGRQRRLDRSRASPYSLSGTVSIPQGDTLTIGLNAIVVCGDNSGFSGAGTIANAGTFTMSSADNGNMEVDPQFVDTGTVQVKSGVTLNVTTNIIVNGRGRPRRRCEWVDT